MDKIDLMEQDGTLDRNLDQTTFVWFDPNLRVFFVCLTEIGFIDGSGQIFFEYLMYRSDNKVDKCIHIHTYDSYLCKPFR